MVYKIRRKSDGLFSSGGSGPRFSTKEKAWATIGQLKNHLQLFKDWRHSYTETFFKLPIQYKDCEIVSYTEVEGAVVKLESFLDSNYPGMEIL